VLLKWREGPMKERVIEFEDYIMRLLKVDDVDEYYKYGFEVKSI
jgi:hypothetical protein